ncbi:LADA_0D05182g1_1 [Lachancea dasiensis]|uniref:LADA_0D05182g1_1 n=1 Tax=Lachancea dasiensis TaxID=1072105 RepID=A0A1G4J5B8_9SACH|nr:LADA_0D05182g1_1 [Lachancea dasiensis]
MLGVLIKECGRLRSAKSWLCLALRKQNRRLLVTSENRLKARWLGIRRDYLRWDKVENNKWLVETKIFKVRGFLNSKPRKSYLLAFQVKVSKVAILKRLKRATAVGTCSSPSLVESVANQHVALTEYLETLTTSFEYNTPATHVKARVFRAQSRA